MAQLSICCRCLLVAPLVSLCLGDATFAGGYTPLTPRPAKIVGSSPAFSAEYAVANLLQPEQKTTPHPEYASQGQGVRTHVDFDLGAGASLSGFRHIQRRSRDLVVEAELQFSDSPDFQAVLARVPIHHRVESSGGTFAAFPATKGRYVRWQVKSLAPENSGNVGGQIIEFFTPADPDPKPTALAIEVRTPAIVRKSDGGLTRTVEVSIRSPYAEEIPVTLRVEGQAPRPLRLRFGRQDQRVDTPALDSAQKLAVEVEAAGERVASRTVELVPLRPLTVYVLPHSHTDIGYTTIQTDIEEKQVNNLLLGISEARRTASYPEGARFVWNVEAVWAARLFLERLPASRREEFLAAVRKGQVALNGMYLNELTGLCRPEELLRLFREATRLGEETGVPIDAAMISDVPGYTWGTVTAMNQAGIRYFSAAPNYFDRIGDILVQWENRPFWWVGPDGTSRVLVWIPYKGYAMSMLHRQLSAGFVRDYVDALEQRSYPYEIAYIRWAGIGDNAVPDASICDFVRDWNAAYASPRFVISSTSEAFRAFERKHGDRLPVVRGDWTPYWEDGAGSSAAETAMNRSSSERLAQAEALWALLNPAHFPADRFDRAWRDVLLYSEHTWGAHCSITRPGIPFTTDQWTIKQGFATAANLNSRRLLSEAAQAGSGFEAPPRVENSPRSSPVDVYNTSSDTRSEVVLLPRELSDAGDFVVDEAGVAVPAQRLSTDELAVLVLDLPPFSGRRYIVRSQGTVPALPRLTITNSTIGNERLLVRVDEETGSIAELRAEGIADNLVESKDGHALNEYLYLIGDDVANVARNGPAKITIKDSGPLVASLLVESPAPGCHTLSRTIRLVAGADHVELRNTVDKKRLDVPSYMAKTGKESVNFAFPFHVPGGEIRLDLPIGVIRPEADQIPGSCKNWLTMGHWADVSNADHGVTWVSLDAPLVQLGGLTATLLNSQTNPDVWLKKIGPTQAIYAWAMNNHWGTNYRAYQEGPVLFRFALRPHRGPANDVEASRFAEALARPLVAVPGRGQLPSHTPLLTVEPADVRILGLKPSDDRKALIVRLTGAGGQARAARLSWGQTQPGSIRLSDTSERPGKPIDGDIPVPAHGIVTLRAELPNR